MNTDNPNLASEQNERAERKFAEPAAHTPGPWSQHDDVKPYGRDYAAAVWGPAGPGYGLIADCTRCGAAHSDAERIANARLIAAAPDMLAALQWLLGNKWKSDKDNMEFTGTIGCYQMDKIREAVTKATGAA